MKKLYVALAMSFGVMAGVSANAQAEETLKIGVEAMYPPFESKTADGKLVGFDIELGDAVCAKMKVKCEWVESSFDGLIPALNARKFDFINSAMNITEPRQRVINFTVPIYDVPSQLIVHKDTQIDLTADVLKAKDITVGVLQGSAQESFAKKHWQAKGVKVVSYQNQDQVYADLANNRIQAALQKTPSARATFLDKEEGKDFKLVDGFADDPSVLGVGTGFGIRKSDTALKERLDAAIEELKKEGFISELSKKYFNADWVAKSN
ncbi:MAG: transporter substrate-binding domain-containing protein [Pelistega sp.]|nr:transporter substrate-binding domain-containing protein [Pelistega sp.]